MFRRLTRLLLWGFLGFLGATKLIEWLVESWWFDSEGYASVFRLMLATRAVAFCLSALLFGLILESNVRIAWRASLPSGFPEPLFDRSFRRRVRAFRVLVWMLAFFAGCLSASRWMVWQRFLHAPTDSDSVTWYLLRLPALNWAWNFVFVCGWLALLLTAAIYSAEGALQWEEKRFHISPRALRHLAAIGAALLVWKALGYALSVPNLHLGIRGDFFGAFYVDEWVRASLASVLAGVALGCALSLGRLARRGRARQTLGPPLVYLAASWLVGTVVPAMVQRVRVEPNELGLERPFLKRHLAATRRAYGLDDVQVLNHAPQPLSAPQLESQLDGLPLWPPEALREVLNREQAKRDATLHIAHVALDVYPIGGEMRPVYVAAREKTGQPLNAFNWASQHEQNTHGNGLVICDAARTTPQGGPLFYLGFDGRAANGARFSARETSLFFAQWRFVASPWGRTSLDAVNGQDAPKTTRTQAPPASLLNPPHVAPPTSQSPQAALTVPDSPVQSAQMGPGLPNLTSPVQSSRDERGRYVVAASKDVEGHGVALGNWWHKALLAWRFLDVRLGLSAQKSSQRVLWHRDVVERCREIAPFLWWEDADPRPVLNSQGRIVWLLDAYEISADYPDSQPLPSLGANFLRHAAWAAVDAQSGQTRFYASTLGPENPLLDVTRRIFPDLLRDARSMPADLQAHLRYPTTLLTAQAQIWGRYHVGAPEQLFARAEEWSPAAIPQPPPYDAIRPILRPANLALSGSRLATFQPMTPLQPRTSGLKIPAAAPLTALLVAAPAPDAQRFVLRLWTPKSAPPELALGITKTDNPAPDETTLFNDRTDSALSLALSSGADALLSARGEWNPVDQSGLKRTFVVADARSQFAGDSASMVAQRFARLNAPTPILSRRASRPTGIISPSLPPQSPGQTLQQVRARWRQMQAARSRRDWTTYGQAERALNALLKP